MKFRIQDDNSMWIVDGKSPKSAVASFVKQTTGVRRQVKQIAKIGNFYAFEVGPKASGMIISATSI